MLLRMADRGWESWRVKLENKMEQIRLWQRFIFIGLPPANEIGCKERRKRHCVTARSRSEPVEMYYTSSLTETLGDYHSVPLP